MKPDLQKILESKRALRKQLAELPIGEKLRMLDALRERHLAIRGSSSKEESGPGAKCERPEPKEEKEA